MRMLRPVLQLLAGALLLGAGPVLAQELAVPEQEETAPEPAPQPIASGVDAQLDGQIQRRVSGIFSQIPALANVTVSVREGVVTLDGVVADPDDRKRAKEIAARVTGVVTVVNDIERDVSVGGGIQSVSALTQKMSAIGQAAPLFGLAILVGIVIGLFGYLLAGLGGLWRRLAPNSFFAELLASAIRFAFVIGGIVVALDMVGAGALLGAVLGGAGIIGIALGFAMRDTIENYVASLMLSVRQPFRANDWVLIDDMEGRVIRLTSRATILMTLDGNHLRIPNSTVFKAVILNYTRNPQRRFEFDLGIDADDDPTAARHLGEKVLRELPFVLDEPPPAARVMEVGDSNIVIRFLGWIDQNETDWYKSRSRAIPAVKSALEHAGFAIPEPIYRLRFDSRGPMPIQMGDATVTEAKPSRPAPAPTDVEPHDVRPDNEIVQMVEDERRAGAKEKDLLDSRRPVE